VYNSISEIDRMSKRLSPRARRLWAPWKWNSRTLKKPSRCRSRVEIERLESRSLLAAITEYPIPSNSGSANQIVTGPDGNLWFTENDPVSNAIGRITPSGQITEYKIPTSGANPFGITVGPDKNLWFTEEFGDKIGQITPSGKITEFPIPASGQFPEGIVTGPDGNLWFTENLGHSIAKMTTSGTVTQYPLPALSAPINITVGPNGNLWFTDKGGVSVGQITTSGTITEYKLPSIIADPNGIVTGPQNKDLWVTEDFYGKIAEISPQGTVLNEYTVPGNFPQPNGITVGPNGSLYFVEQGGKNVDQITVGGTITQNAIPGSNAQPHGITLGPDNNIWFTDQGNKSIGRLSVSATTTPTPTPTPTPVIVTPTPTPTPSPTPTPTPTTTSSTTPFTGTLSPGSDTGPSSSDGITNNNQPTFVGTAPAGQTVTLFEFANGSSNPVIIGQGVATDAGTWSITPAQALADGSYVIDASVTGGTNVIQILPTATEGRLVIDTAGPRINNATVDPPVGEILLNLAENGSGLNLRQLLNPSTYTVTGPSGRRDTHVALALLPGGADGSTNLALTLDGGRALRRGRYTVRIRAAALGDLAGNPLNGSLYFGFPTGTGTTSGDFMMTFQTDGVSATAPTLPGFIAAGDARYLAALRKQLRNGPV
jgi:streptogramin lyase